MKFEFSSSLFPNGKVDEDFLAALEEKEKEEHLSSSSTIHNADYSSFALNTNTNTNTSENDAASNDNPSSARIFLDSLENGFITFIRLIWYNFIYLIHIYM